VFAKSVISGIRDVITTTMRRIYEHLAAAKLGRCAGEICGLVCAFWQGRRACQLRAQGAPALRMCCHMRAACDASLTSPFALPLCAGQAHCLEAAPPALPVPALRTVPCADCTAPVFCRRRTAWKLLKDFKVSVARKAEYHVAEGVASRWLMYSKTVGQGTALMYAAGEAGDGKVLQGTVLATGCTCICHILLQMHVY
jgi:hypothetical protein